MTERGSSYNGEEVGLDAAHARRIESLSVDFHPATEGVSRVVLRKAIFGPGGQR